MNPIKFISIAKAMAELSKDPSTQVGCIILDDDQNVLSVGYNGFPRGVKDSPERYFNREVKLKFVAHAESNAVAQAARVGAKLLGSTMVVTALYPCINCTKTIIQAGVKKVYAPKMANVNNQWLEEKWTSAQMFLEAGVEVIEYDPD